METITQEQPMSTATEASTRWWLRTDQVSTVIASTPEQMYDLVADLPRMGEWSPECLALEWLDGSNSPVEGATFEGHNVGGPKGLMKWSRQGRVLTAERGREFSFCTEEGGKESTIWRYSFEPVEGGCGSPSPTTCGGFPRGPASSMCPPTGSRNCARA